MTRSSHTVKVRIISAILELTKLEKIPASQRQRRSFGAMRRYHQRLVHLLTMHGDYDVDRGSSCSGLVVFFVRIFRLVLHEHQRAHSQQTADGNSYYSSLYAKYNQQLIPQAHGDKPWVAGSREAKPKSY